MRALIASPQSDERIELRDVPDPIAGPDETLVEVRAVSLNRGELTRLAASEDGTRFGWDFAAVVVQPSADGRGLPQGTRVVGFVMNTAWAQLTAVTNNRLAALPAGISFEQASTLPVAGLTALRTLQRGGLLLGKRVLVTGASGGVGRFAVQLGHLAGAHITGLASSAQRAKAVRDYGADEAVTTLDTTGEPFDLILESVGGSTLAAAMGSIKPGGTIVTFGNSSREQTVFNISPFYGRSDASLQGFSLLAPSEPPNFGEDLAYLAGLVADGRLAVEIGYQGSWREAATALRALRERKVEGKAVLLVD